MPSTRRIYIDPILNQVGVRTIRSPEEGNLQSTGSIEEVGIDQGWERFFSSRLHSEARMKILVPKALEWFSDLEATGSHGVFTEPSNFPKPILDWFEGQKELLFFDRHVSGPEDIYEVYKRLVGASQSSFGTV